MNTATTHTALTSMPAYLFLGPHELVFDHTVRMLQVILCPHDGCGACSRCRGIAQQQHHAITWISPEKWYTRDELNPIMEQLALQLDDDQHHFFIVQKADLLTSACANNLLKVVEEPPRGYHFIFLAEVKDALPATIVSRCVVQTLGSHTRSSNVQALFETFTTATHCSPAVFLKTVEQSKCHETQSSAIINDLLHYWIEQQRNSLATDSTPSALIEARIELLKRYIVMPPMPGSSKLLWHTLFAQWELLNAKNRLI